MENYKKRMPQNLESEKQVLSHIFTYTDEAEDIITRLTRDDFFNEEYSDIFKQLQSGIDNLELIIQNLSWKHIEIERTLENIIVSRQKISGVSDHIEILKHNSKYRKMIEFGEMLKELGYEKEDLSEENFENFEKMINEVDIKDELTNIYQESIEYLDNYEIKPNFIKCRLKSLDDRFFFERGDLIVVGARPSIGKSAFLLQLALGYSYCNNKTIAFSLEMKNNQLAQRVLSNITKIELNKIRSKNLSVEEKKNLEMRLHKHLKNRSLKITDNVYSYDKLIEIIKKEKKENGLDVVMIDYLQLIPTSGKRNKNEEVGAITRNLKLIAKKYDIGIVILSQLNRGVEQRSDKRPIMSDLRDSGEIEQDIDSCLMLYRDEYYDENTQDQNIMEVLIRKQRQGSVGSVSLYFDLPTQRIVDLEE